jgi:hypothetical protein
VFFFGSANINCKIQWTDAIPIENNARTVFYQIELTRAKKRKVDSNDVASCELLQQLFQKLLALVFAKGSLVGKRNLRSIYLEAKESVLVGFGVALRKDDESYVKVNQTDRRAREVTRCVEGGRKVLWSEATAMQRHIDDVVWPVLIKERSSVQKVLEAFVCGGGGQLTGASLLFVGGRLGLLRPRCYVTWKLPPKGAGVTSVLDASHWTVAVDLQSKEAVVNPRFVRRLQYFRI